MEKKTRDICILLLFELSLKNALLPPIFFLDSKNTSVLVGDVLSYVNATTPCFSFLARSKHVHTTVFFLLIKFWLRPAFTDYFESVRNARDLVHFILKAFKHSSFFFRVQKHNFPTNHYNPAFWNLRISTWQTPLAVLLRPWPNV